MSDIEIFVRLTLSCLLGGIVGLEREAQGRAAGLRTHILVCLGSALIMMTSIYLFDKYSANNQMDPARLAGHVVSGIGFLGAGTIIRAGFSVKGLTTAASLWVVAALGLAVGCGFWKAAAATTVLVLIGLVLFGKISHRVFSDNEKERKGFGEQND